MNILDRIHETKRQEVASLPSGATDADRLAAQLETRGRRDFMHALRHPPKGQVALIAEIKKASPSKGIICPDFDPEAIRSELLASGVLDNYLSEEQIRGMNEADLVYIAAVLFADPQDFGE